MNDIYVRYISLPFAVEGTTVTNNDGTFSVYINSDRCEETQSIALKHELAHINKNHLYDYNLIAVNECEANKILIKVN